MRARALAFIPILAITMAIAPAFATDPLVGPCSANDAGNTAATASLIGTPAACTSTLAAGDADFYGFEVTAGLTIALNVASARPDALNALSLRDPSGADQSASCDAARKGCIVNKATAGRWIVGLVYVSGSATDYALAVALAPGAPEQSCETAGDAPNSSPTARGVTPPLACGGKLDPVGDTDWFTFKAKAGASIATALVRQSGGPFTLTLMGPNGVRSCTNDAASFCSVTAAEGGDWFVGIKGRSSTAVGEYIIAISLTEQFDPVPYTCEPTDASATNDDTATELKSPAACTGKLGSATDRDVYRFEVVGQPGGAAAAAVTVAPLNGSVYDVSVTDPTGRAVACTAARAVACSIAQAAPGRYYLAISRGGGTAGPYAVGILVASSQVPPPPDVIPATCETTGDAGGTTASAKNVEHPAACTGKIADNIDVDVYSFKINASPGDAVAAAVAVAPLSNSSYSVTVTAPSGTPMTCTNDPATVCTHANAASGTWYVAITRGSSSPGAYVLGIVVANANPTAIPTTIRDAAAGAVSSVLGGATTPCEPTADAGSTPATAGALPWTSMTETATLCRGSVLLTDTTDVFKFLVRTNGASTVRVMLTPESDAVDLTLSLTPPPGTCEPTDQVDGQCPTITSQLGRHGQPDYVEKAIGSGGKSGDWIITVGQAPNSPGGYYELGVHIQGS